MGGAGGGGPGRESVRWGMPVTSDAEPPKWHCWVAWVGVFGVAFLFMWWVSR